MVTNQSHSFFHHLRGTFFMVFVEVFLASVSSVYRPAYRTFQSGSWHCTILWIKVPFFAFFVGGKRSGNFQSILDTWKKAFAVGTEDDSVAPSSSFPDAAGIASKLWKLLHMHYLSMPLGDKCYHLSKKNRFAYSGQVVVTKVRNFWNSIFASGT